MSDPNAKTAFENLLLPCRASFFLRLMAAIYDAVSLLLILALLAGAGTAFVFARASVEKTKPKPKTKIVKMVQVGSCKKSPRSGKQEVCISVRGNRVLWFPVRELQNVFLLLTVVFFIFAVFWQMIPLCFRAQTRGMRYFGIFISDAGNPRTEVLEVRAALWYLFSLLTCFLTPFFLIVGKPTLAERLTRTRLIQVAAK